jgi:hypothetical protein
MASGALRSAGGKSLQRSGRLARIWGTPARRGFHRLAEAMISGGAEAELAEAVRIAEQGGIGAGAALKAELVTVAQTEWSPDIPFQLDLVAVAVVPGSRGGVTPSELAATLVDAGFFPQGSNVRAADGWYRVDQVSCLSPCASRAVMRRIVEGCSPALPGMRQLPLSVGYSVLLTVVRREGLDDDEYAGEGFEEPPCVLTDSGHAMESSVEGWRAALRGGGMASDAVRPCMPLLLAGEIAVRTTELAEAGGRQGLPAPQPTIH